MADLAVARRFHEAVVRAAQRVGSRDRLPELLLRLGLPGLASRLALEPAAPRDPAARRLHQLYDTLAREQARRIGAALEAAGVEHFFAKGIALLGGVYQPGDRVISDLDLYVPPAARLGAIERLSTLGYAPLAETDQAGPPALRSSLALARPISEDPQHLTVDLHWAVDPVRRLLPRADHPLPARFWPRVETRDGLRVPTPEHHAALLAHHLVHGDLTHVRSLLDLAFLFAELPPEGGTEYLAAAGELGVAAFARDVATLVARDLGVARPRAESEVAPRARPAGRLTLDAWLARLARTPPADHSAITTRRIRTRIGVLGWRAVPGLLVDVVAPPAAFLAWRWPRAGPARALARHYGQVARKALGGLAGRSPSGLQSSVQPPDGHR